MQTNRADPEPPRFHASRRAAIAFPRHWSPRLSASRHFTVVRPGQRVGAARPSCMKATAKRGSGRAIRMVGVGFHGVASVGRVLTAAGRSPTQQRVIRRCVAFFVEVNQKIMTPRLFIAFPPVLLMLGRDQEVALSVRGDSGRRVGRNHQRRQTHLYLTGAWWWTKWPTDGSRRPPRGERRLRLERLAPGQDRLRRCGCRVETTPFQDDHLDFPSGTDPPPPGESPGALSNSSENLPCRTPLVPCARDENTTSLQQGVGR